MLRRGTKRIFYGCIVCITHLGVKFTEVSVVHTHTCSFCLTARICNFGHYFRDVYASGAITHLTSNPVSKSTCTCSCCAERFCCGISICLPSLSVSYSEWCMKKNLATISNRIATTELIGIYDEAPARDRQCLQWVKVYGWQFLVN